MRRRFSADKALFFRKKKKSNKNKLQISVLATEARINIDENQQLSDTIDILNNLVKKTKEILYALTSKKIISKIEIINNLKEEKNGHLILNKNLKGERNFMRLKNNKTKRELNQTLSNFQEELDIIINRKFIYENALLEKQLIIKTEKLKIINIKLIGENEEEKFFKGDESDKIFSKINLIYQLILLNKCKLFNKIQNKCFKLFNRKKLLLDEIYYLNKGFENSNVFNIDNHGLLKKTDEDDSILNESLSSTVEEDFINIPFIQKNLEQSLIDKISIVNKFKMPKLLVEQIRYNNERNRPGEAEKSLSRILEKNEDSKDLKIKNLKENIKKLKKRIKQKEIKCKEYEEKIKIMKKKYSK